MQSCQYRTVSTALVELARIVAMHAFIAGVARVSLTSTGEGSLVFTCVASDVKCLRWWVGEDVVASYTPSIHHTFPLSLQSSVSGILVKIQDVQYGMIWGQYYSIHSTMTLNRSCLPLLEDRVVRCGNKNVSEEMLIQSDTSYDRNALSTSLLSNESLSEVHLTSNVTLEGEMCPGGVEFTCSARNLSFLSWFLDDVLLVQYNVEESHDYPLDLCDQVPDNQGYM